MMINFTPYFKKYEAYVRMADQAFKRVKNEYLDCVKCKIECSDCCYALFDLTLIEAIYINNQFDKKFSGEEKENVLQKANFIDRKIHKIKKKAYIDLRAGRNEGEILTRLAAERVRCPLLNSKKRCDLYEYRPITCRFYGIPTAIGGTGHTCGKSGFVQGRPYPTVNLDLINRQLQEITAEFVRDIKTKYVKMADILVPLSMAMLTVYDEEYLGIENHKADAASKK
jgi:Fe-S-cluster containining protein